MKKNNIESLIKWIESQPKFKPKTDLKRMKQAMKLKHITMDNSYMIHVAGTNGKGSVSQFLTQIYGAQGLTVGTFSSPYILNFNERITINHQPLSDDELADLLCDMKQFNTSFYMQYGEPLSFFELLTLAAFVTFQALHVDVVIMEVGIGGLLDATNAYDYYDLSLITNIGYDHMKQLGNTLESIASNKLGILKEHSHLITTVDTSLHHYFKQMIKPLHIKAQLLQPQYKIVTQKPLTFVYDGHTYTSGLHGNYQVNNAILAIEAIKASPFNISYDTIRKGLEKACIPARFTMINDQLIIDGAHNIHAIKSLSQSLKGYEPHKKFHVVFSALGDKSIKDMLDHLKTFAMQIDLVSFPDVRYLSLKPYVDEGIRYIEMDAINYVNQLLSTIDEHTLILVTGSLHFAGYMLQHYK